MNVLITGITGFIGSNLYHYLKKHHNNEINVYALTRDPHKVTLRLGDSSVQVMTSVDHQILDSHKIDVIVHLAGIAHDLSGIYKEKDYEEVNYGLTKQLYDQFLTSKSTDKFIFISSVKALADSMENEVLIEEHLSDPRTPYGRSKRKAENYILKTGSKKKKAYVLRPSMVYGSGNKGNLNLLYGLIKSGYPYPLGAFRNKRSFLAVENLSFIISEIILKEIKEGDYNCADGFDISTVELVELICEVLGKPVRILKINEKIIRNISKIGSYCRLPLNENTLKKLTENYQVSVDKLLNALDIKEMPYDTKSRLKTTIKSFECN